MEYLRKLHMICFTVEEFLELFKNDQLRKIEEKLAEKGLSLIDLQGNKEKMEEIANEVVSKNLKNKEMVEIFSALNSAVVYYGKDSKICLVLKDSCSPKKQEFNSLDELVSVTKEDTLTDFAIFSSGLRQFQLKQYKNSLNTDDLFVFINKYLKKYGYDLGEINLLIQLQGNGDSKHEINFEEIFEKLKKLNLKFTGQILVSYNEANEFNVMNQVYPDLTTSRREIDEKYLAGEIFYQ